MKVDLTKLELERFLNSVHASIMDLKEQSDDLSIYGQEELKSLIMLEKKLRQAEVDNSAKIEALPKSPTGLLKFKPTKRQS